MVTKVLSHSRVQAYVADRRAMKSTGSIGRPGRQRRGTNDSEVALTLVGVTLFALSAT